MIGFQVRQNSMNHLDGESTYLGLVNQKSLTILNLSA